MTPPPLGLGVPDAVEKQQMITCKGGMARITITSSAFKIHLKLFLSLNFTHNRDRKSWEAHMLQAITHTQHLFLDLYKSSPSVSSYTQPKKRKERK